MEIFKLFGSVLIDNDKADKSIAATEKKGEGLAKTFGNGIKTVAKWGAAIGGAAIAGAAAIIGLATKVGNTADRLLDLNSITGMTTDEIQRWERVTKVAGVSTEAVTGAAEKFNKSLNTMSSETNKGNIAMRELGLSFEDIENMNADDRMNALTAALADVDDKTERAKLGADLFGGSWKDIAPIVDLGAEAMDKAKASANIISEDDLNKANDFRIKMAEMRDQAGHFAMMLGIKVLPIAEKLFEQISDHMPQIQAFVSRAFEVIGNAVETGVEWIVAIIGWIKEFREENAAELAAIQEKFVQVFDIIGKAFEWVKENFDIIGPAIAAMLLAIVVPAFIAWAVAARTAAVATIAAMLPVLAPIAAIGVAAVALGLIWKKWGGDIQNFIGSAVNGVTSLFENLRSKTLGIWDGIYGGIKATINLIIGAVNGMIRGLNKIKFEVPSWVPGFGGKGWGFDIGEIPKLAKGGNIVERGRVLVGEQGPEELLLPAGAKVTPLDDNNKFDYDKLAKIIAALQLPAEIILQVDIRELEGIKTIMELLEMLRLKTRLAGGEI